MTDIKSEILIKRFNDNLQKLKDSGDTSKPLTKERVQAMRKIWNETT